MWYRKIINAELHPQEQMKKLSWRERQVLKARGKMSPADFTGELETDRRLYFRFLKEYRSVDIVGDYHKTDTNLTAYAVAGSIVGFIFAAVYYFRGDLSFENFVFRMALFVISFCICGLIDYIYTEIAKKRHQAQAEAAMQILEEMHPELRGDGCMTYADEAKARKAHEDRQAEKAEEAINSFNEFLKNHTETQA